MEITKKKLGTRNICGYCSNKDNLKICNPCSWFTGKYPTNYIGKKFKSTKGMDAIF